MCNTYPIISFIVAVYNNEKYLSCAVRSVLDTKTDRIDSIELIIVDDGSTDDTPYIADQLAEEDSRITVIHQSNQWIYASFNNGIRAAKGEYIYILNSDDVLVEGAIQKLIDAVEKYNRPDVIWTKVLFREVDNEQNTLSERDMDEMVFEDEYIDQIEMIHDRWLFVQESNLAVNQANLYKRELALKYPFRNDIYAADSFFNLGIADHIKSMAILKDAVYVYMAYSTPGMNASLGKYYGYEHRMFQEKMMKEINLYKAWGCLDRYLEHVVNKRLREVTFEIMILSYSNCRLSFNEKLNKIFGEIADRTVRKYARMVGREREYESRILNGTKELVEKNGSLTAIPNHIRALLSYLPEDYRSNVDEEKIDYDLVNAAVYADFNKDNIGKIYYSQKW